MHTKYGGYTFVGYIYRKTDTEAERERMRERTREREGGEGAGERELCTYVNMHVCE